MARIDDICRELEEKLEHFKESSELATGIAAMVKAGALILNPEFCTDEQRETWAEMRTRLLEYGDAVESYA